MSMKRIISSIILSFVITQAHRVFPDTSTAWDVYCCSLIGKNAIWLFVLFTFIPYKQLLTKTTIFLCFIYEMWDCLFYFIWQFIGGFYGYAYTGKALLCLSLLFFMIFRGYDKENDELDNDHFFLIAIIPNNFQNFVLSLFRRPIGGVGIYVRGDYFHYYRGKIVKHDANFIMRRKHKYKIIKERRIDGIRIDNLKTVLYSTKYQKWSLRYNCVTVFIPILSNRAGPL